MSIWISFTEPNSLVAETNLRDEYWRLLIEPDSSIYWASTNGAWLQVFSALATSLKNRGVGMVILLWDWCNCKITQVNKWFTWCPQPKAMSFLLVRQMGQTCNFKKKRQVSRKKSSIESLFMHQEIYRFKSKRSRIEKLANEIALNFFQVRVFAPDYHK